MIYYLIPHGHGVCFHVLQARVAHWHYHSAIRRSTVSLRSSSPGPPQSSLLCFFSSGFQVLHPTKQTSFCYFGFSCWLLSHPIETSFHHAPLSMNEEQHPLSCAPPQMFSLSLCCQPPSLICMVTFFSLSLSSAALGLHTSHVQDPSILISLWEELCLPSSESKLMLVL